MRTRPRSLWRRPVAVVLAGLLAVTLAGAANAAPPGTGEVVPSEPRQERPVDGHDLPVLPRKPDPASQAALKPSPTAARAGLDPTAAKVTVGKAVGRAAAPVEAEILGGDAAAKAGVAGVVVKLRRAGAGGIEVPVTVDYSSLRNAYGGDWAHRLRLIDLATRKPLASTNDTTAGRLTGTVPMASSETTVAVAAAPEGPTGDYRATSLSPAGTWQVGQQSGNFAWSHELPSPPVPGGLAPQVKAAYDSGGTDGRTASTNNQPSWVGEGWSLWPGFIERSYMACADDLGGNNGQTKTGDLCWETDNASLSFDGRATDLVFQGGTWRPKIDDGTKVEHLFDTTIGNGDDDGEFWRVTTTDGIQYLFGSRSQTQSTWTVPVFGNDPNEPCRGASFAASSCPQAWRWNLDHVIDPHRNTITYYYARETNSYGRNLATATAEYTRGGTLLRAEYGTRAGDTGQAPARVVFDAAERCVPGSACARNAADYPDVPWDQHCDTATCPGKVSPTFWTSKRLAKVTTQVLHNGGYRDVDAWTFDHIFPAPGDSTSAGLWLRGITHTGLVGGTAAKPAVTFNGDAKANRVTAASDPLPDLRKYRIETVNTESGGLIDVVYAPPNCFRASLPAADTNALRCFLVRWARPPVTEPIDDWFHKYVVAQVIQVDRVGGSKRQVTDYSYLGDAAWHYHDNPLVPEKHRTWSQWRGYEKVLVTKGDPVVDPGQPRSATQYQYFRGMHGDRRADKTTKTARVVDSAGTALDDEEPLAGFLREEIRYADAGGPVVTGSIHTPWKRGPTATQGSLQAFQVENSRTVTRTALSAGGFRTTQADTTFDHEGNPIKVNDLGDLATPRDDRCTLTSYARNTNTWLLTLPRQVTTVGVACDRTPSYPDDAISDVRSYYDGGALDAAPTAGNLTMTEEAKSYSGSTPSYQTTARSRYDGYGRVLEATDALGHTTTTSYTPAIGLPTSIAVTNPLHQTATTTLEIARNQPLAVADVAGRRTELAYDPLGRVTGVWRPGRDKSAGIPNVRYTYGLRGDGPSFVATETLNPNGAYVAGYALYDGFLRPRQVQAPSPVGGRVITDTIYNSRGLLDLSRQPYYNLANPGTTVFQPDNGAVPNATSTRFDGAERPVSTHFLKFNDEQLDFRTTTVYGGDHVKVTPPKGGTATATWTDARGQVTELRQYHAGTPSGTYDATRYDYTKAGDLETVTDADGNTWRNDYDVRGRKIRATDPDHGATTMTYDAADQLRTTTDARGETAATTYDPLGRRTGVRKGSETGPLLAEWTYDTISPGALTSSTRRVGANAYVREVTGYDAGGRPTGERITIPASETGVAGTYETAMTYRVDGSPATVTLPALSDTVRRETLVHGYERRLGLPSTLKGATTYVGGIKYTAFGELAQVEMGLPPVEETNTPGRRVWQTSYYEDGTRRLNSVLTERERPGSVKVDELSYSYDPAGNVTAVADARPGVATDSQCFKYDYLRRTTEAWTQSGVCAAAPGTTAVGGPAPYWLSFAYDRIGNRKTQVRHGLGGTADAVSTYTYPAAGQPRPHAVQSVRTTGPGAGDVTYAYDTAGNTTGRPGPDGRQELTWSTEGTLDTVSAGGKTTSYVYDADGNQLIRRDPGAVTLFVGGGEVRVNNATGARAATRYYDAKGLTAARTSGGALSWLVADHHSTPLLAVNASTLDAAGRRFDLFGNARGGVAAVGAGIGAGAADAVASAWPGGERGFVGGTGNDATGLTRLGAREYDPSIGKFLSVDPVLDPTDPQQMNAHAYANNNPTTMSDPDGLRFFEGNDGGWSDPAPNRAAPRRPKPPVKPAKSRAHRNDFGGRCPRGDVAHCRDVTRRANEQKKKESRARQHDWTGPDGRKGRVTDPDLRKRGAQHAAIQPFIGRLPDELADPIVAMRDLLDSLATGTTKSISLCAEAEAGAILGAEVTACANFDNVGVTFSRSQSAGLEFGADVDASVALKFNTYTADKVHVAPADHLKLGFEVGHPLPVHFGIAHESYPMTPEKRSVVFKLGIGAGFSVGSYHFRSWSDSSNSGYVHRW